MRARYIGGGSDLERLDRQHVFLSAVIRQASSNGLLTNPVKLYDVLSQVAKALTVDAGLSGDGLKQFLLSLQRLKPSAVRFYTVPNAPRGDNENVVWVQKSATPLWRAMIDDTAYAPKSSASSSSAAPTASTGSAAPRPATAGSAADTRCLT
ncbi:MAG: hypothetical protein U0R68_09165 [Candidatus Nanopelagicales bacterium]